jgi:enoyl-CoA hydratase
MFVAHHGNPQVSLTVNRSPHPDEVAVPHPEALFETTGSIARLTFNRPAARNALTWTMYDALVAACAAVDANADVRALVIRGAGDAFAAGSDIRQFAEFKSGDDGIAYEKRLDSVIDRLERVTVPTIAQVHGVAAGGGCVIALACDLRVCSPDARFGVPIARTLGNCLSVANCARLIDAVGAARASDLVFTGRLVDVAEADGMGLVTRIAELSAIDAAVEELVATIAANAPLTIRAAKVAFHRLAAHRRLAAGQDAEFIAACYGSADFREGITAFLEKRRPRFSGR